MSELQFQRSVWVSYSGADKELVHKLTKQVNGNGELIKMLTYLRDDSDDKPSHQSKLSESDEFNHDEELQVKEPLTTYLKPWESIDDLIQTIGSNLRRMIFLSNNYIQSDYCMQEFMCILTRSPHSPLLFVLVGVDSFNALCQSRSYAFLQENEESEIPHLTLAQALAKVYLRRKIDKKMTPEFELPDDNENSLIDFFTQRLKTVGDRLRTRVDCNTEDKEGYICKATLSENCNELQRFLSVYVKNFSVETITERYKETKKGIIHSWLNKTTLGKKCKEELDVEQVLIPLSSRDIEQIESLCDVIYEKSEDLSLDKAKVFEQAQPIISLMLTSVISEEWAAEIHFNSIINSPTRLSVTNKDPESLFFLSIGLAAANMHQLTVSRITKDNQTPKVDQVFDILPNALEEDASLQNPIIEDILQLVSGLSKEEVVSMLKNDQPYKIRNRINRYQRKFASNMQECNLPPIVLRASHIDFHQRSKDIPHEFAQFLTRINSDMRPDPNDKKINFGLLIVKNDVHDNVVLIGDSTADAILLAVKSLIVELTK